MSATPRDIFVGLRSPLPEEVSRLFDGPPLIQVAYAREAQGRTIASLDLRATSHSLVWLSNLLVFGDYHETVEPALVAAALTGSRGSTLWMTQIERFGLASSGELLFREGLLYPQDVGWTMEYLARISRFGVTATSSSGLAIRILLEPSCDRLLTYLS
jgi:hypothetical protein